MTSSKDAAFVSRTDDPIWPHQGELERVRSLQHSGAALWGKQEFVFDMFAKRRVVTATVAALHRRLTTDA
jgi:hypothetical protein